MGLKERIFGKKNEKEFDFSAAAANTDIATTNNSASQEYVDTLGKIGYLLDSPTMNQFLTEEKEMQDLIPAFQSVIRTTKITGREAEIMWLNYKTMFLAKKAKMAGTYRENDPAVLFQALSILADSIISDAKDGWKGHLATENTRRLDVVLNKKERR